jgi:hypothetical protein
MCAFPTGRTRPAPRALCLWAAILVLAGGESGAADRGSDGRYSERRSQNFALFQDVDIDRYTGAHGSRKFERDVLVILERAHDEVRDALGIEPSGRSRVIVYDPGVYDREFAELFGFRSAGFFDGAMHVRGATALDARLVRTLHHEYVHAALASQVPQGTLPVWLNEGLAEYFERPEHERTLTRGEAAALAQALAQGQWIPLAQLGGPTLAGFDGPRATLAYLQSFAAIEHLAREHGVERLARLWVDVARAGADAGLRRTYRLELVELEAALMRELGR